MTKTSTVMRPNPDLPVIGGDGLSLATVQPVAKRPAPLTVLIAVPTVEAGAADEGAVALARMLTRTGHRAIVVTRGGRFEPELAACGAEVVHCDMATRNPVVIARNALLLRRLIVVHRCDVVHALARAPAWSAFLATRMTGRPLLTTLFNGFREQNVFKRFYNSVMLRGDRVITASDQIAEAVSERHQSAAARVVVVPPRVDAETFDPARVTSAQIDAVRAAWGVGPETRIILVVGRILQRKGHHVIVHAARRLKDMGLRDFLFVLIGEDDGRSRYSGKLWDLVLATETSDVIRLAGPPADAPAAYCAAVAIVSAAIQLEGQRRSMLEAMAMGRPVIASYLAAGPETVLAPPTVAEDRMTGYRVRSGDDSELATALIRLLSFPEDKRLAMGRRAREHVMSHFAGTAAESQMLAIYTESARLQPRTRGI